MRQLHIVPLYRINSQLGSLIHILGPIAFDTNLVAYQQYNLTEKLSARLASFPNWAQKRVTLLERPELFRRRALLGSFWFGLGAVITRMRANSTNNIGRRSWEINAPQNRRELQRRFRNMAQNCCIQRVRPLLGAVLVRQEWGGSQVQEHNGHWLDWRNKLKAPVVPPVTSIWGQL